MKKLLGIVVLGLLWCNVGFAEDKENLPKYGEDYTNMKNRPSFLILLTSEVQVLTTCQHKTTMFVGKEIAKKVFFAQI